MIDLSSINKFYELKWFDGTSVWLKKPTEGMLRRVSALEDSSELDALDALKDMVIELVKDNMDGRKFPQEELDQLDAVLCSMIFKDYMEEVGKRLGE